MSSDNTQKVPFSEYLPKVAQNEVVNQILQSGKNWPVSIVAVSDAFVTVQFEVTTSTPNALTFPTIQVPQAISRYARPPTQVGDKGFVVAADLHLGGVTGQGGGTAVYGRQEPNLTSIVYVPLSNKAFPSVDNNAYNITGPNGAVIKDDSGASVVTITPSTITINQNGATIVLNGGNITITGVLIINGIPFLDHVHKGVTTGGSDTGGVGP